MDTILNNQVISNSASTVKSNNMSSQNKLSSSEPAQTKKYNLREKKNIDNEKYNLKHDASSDEEDYIPDDSDEYDSEQEEMDLIEYRKFLANIFPSKHASETVKLQDKIKKHVKPIVESEDEEDEEDEEERNASDYDSEDSDEEYQNEKEMGFNILFTISDKRNNNEDSDEEECESDEECEEDANEDECEEDTEKDEKEITKMIKKNNKKNKKSEIQKKDTCEKYDDKTSKALKEMINIFKKKRQNAAPELFKKFEEMIEEEDKKLQQKKIRENKKLIKKNCKKFRSLMYEKSQQDEMKFFKNTSMDEQKLLIEKMELINQHTKVSKPYKLTLIESDIPIHYKAAAIKKINSLNYMDQGSGEYYKIKQWVDTFMKIPFGKYANLPITMEDGIEKCDAFMQKAKDVLNDAVYGLDDAKLQILQMMAQWISNPDAVGNAIAIKGPMGTGKTTLVKHGISKILNRPFAFIALGGATDSSFLEGHSYTYEGSVWGKIVDIIIQCKCMNPIIYFDELDKVSDTAKGDEIIGILTHLTDTTQNTQFHDKYFSGIDFDLSKCLFIFSYNDEHKVNPILRDRMYRIQTQGYNCKQKKTISRDYLIPKIEENVRFNKGEITITDKAIEYMVREYTQGEKGVRNLKRCLEIIYTKLNMYRLMKPNTKLFNDVETFQVQYPFNVNEEIVQKLIKKNENDTFYRHMYV